MSVIGTTYLLREWGRWGADHTSALPSMSPMFGERALKSPLFGGCDMPKDIALLDAAICRLDPEHRRLLQQRYLSHLSHRQLAKLFGIKLWKVNKALKRAEQAVHAQYSKGSRHGFSESSVHV